jgi:glutaconate CoA-transferase subunit B
MAEKQDFAPAELMACFFSRLFEDGDFVGVGAASQIPMAAIKLSRMTRTPNLNFSCGGSGAINSEQPLLTESAADYRNLFGAEYRLSMEDTVEMEFRERWQTVFFGGIQVDRFGNCNMVCVGDYDDPTVRGPGAIGLPLAAAMGRVFISLNHHTPRLLVDKVDFVCAPGNSPEREKWATPNSTGMHLIMTPLAVFDFQTPDRSARLASVHPGISVDEVLEKTGFTPTLADPVAETEPPTADELHLLRTVIDREGVLQRLIA